MAGRPKRRARLAALRRQAEAGAELERAAGEPEHLVAVPVERSEAQRRADQLWGSFRFQPGNSAAVKTGAYSPRLYGPEARDLAEWLVGQETLAYLQDTSYGPTVAIWAQRTAQANRISSAMEDHREETGCVGCKRCVSWEERWRAMLAAVERSERDLGINPKARAEILLRLQLAKVIDVPDPAEGIKSMMSGLQEQLQAYAKAHRDEQ